MKFAAWGSPLHQFPAGQDTKADFAAGFEQMKQAGIEIYLGFVDTSQPRDREVLARCIEAGREFGIEIHPYIGLRAAQVLGPDGQEIMARYNPGPMDEELPDWAAAWPCASWEENRQLVRDTAAAMLKEFDCDGLHMDGMRYPNNSLLQAHPCQCSRCQEARRAWLGKPVPAAEDLARQGVVYLEVKMRNNFIKSLVRALRHVAEEAAVPLSLAARAYYPADPVPEGQDWVDWCEDGLLDFICPMSYTTDMDVFRRFVQNHTRLLAEVTTPLFCGIGRESSAGVLTPQLMAEQIRCAAEYGADGICIFTAASCEAEDFRVLQALKQELG